MENRSSQTQIISFFAKFTNLVNKDNHFICNTYRLLSNRYHCDKKYSECGISKIHLQRDSVLSNSHILNTFGFTFSGESLANILQALPVD